jgi:hypothetical protein
LYLFVPLFERFFVFYVIHWFKCFFEVKIKKIMLGGYFDCAGTIGLAFIFALGDGWGEPRLIVEPLS